MSHTSLSDGKDVFSDSSVWSFFGLDLGAAIRPSGPARNRHVASDPDDFL